MLNRTSFATVSATATRAYADASAIAISPTPNTQEAYKKLSKDIWNPTDRPVFSDSLTLANSTDRVCGRDRLEQVS